MHAVSVDAETEDIDAVLKADPCLCLLSPVFSLVKKNQKLTKAEFFVSFLLPFHSTGTFSFLPIFFSLENSTRRKTSDA